MAKKILWIGDGVAKTGFSTVNHNIIGNLSRKNFDVHHLAINYFGDHTDVKWKVYPAPIGGDLWGFNRLPTFLNDKWDGIFILNDVWVIARYLGLIKEHYKNNKIPPIVVYFPVDSFYLEADWFVDFDIVTKTVVYTNFAYNEVKKVKKDLDVTIIPHGVDFKNFYKIDEPKREIKSKVFPNKEDFLDSFIILNANRNQPRKKINTTLEGFKLFSENKPLNVKLYCHMGVRDMGWDIVKLSQRLGIDNRLIVTNLSPGIQQVSEEKLNQIYNATEVGLNTSTGEGWGLTSHEHAVTGAPQVVPEHSACKELFGGMGLLIPIRKYEVNTEILTVGGIVYPEDVASKLETLYTNKELYDELSKKTLEKFSSDEYSWKNIITNKWLPLLKEAYK